jgi:hypothetical protein
MADEKNKSVVVCSGGLNRNGYRILVDGIMLDSFKSNPIMLFYHGRDDKYSLQYKGQDRERLNLPIGRWENLRIDNGQLLADPVFDIEDEFAAEVARKWEKGFLNACSMGFNFIEWSEDPAYLLQGQTRPTVTKSELLEISIVDIPGDADAVRLTLSANQDPLSVLPLLSNNESKKSSDMELKTIALTLGLPADATEAQVNDKIKAIKATQVEAVLALGRQKGIVNDTNLATMRGMVEQNPDFAKLSWEALPDVKAAEAPKTEQPTNTLSLADMLKSEGKKTKIEDGRENWTIQDWRKNDPNGLLALEKNDNERFMALVNSMVRVGNVVL